MNDWEERTKLAVRHEEMIARSRRGPEYWDRFFLGMAQYISTASKDPSTQTGSVIIRPDRTVASVGYNGFPKGIEDCNWRYDDRTIKYELIIHCEMNAIMSSRERLDGYTLYTHPFLTCHRCSVHVIQAGIKRVVAPACPEHLKDRWAESFKRARNNYYEAGVAVTEYEPEEVHGLLPGSHRVEGCPCAGHEPVD